ncbi:MAG: tripartite tricarboxylate transporter substrate binding protein [Hyphomicrobiales bacterium]|nr:tripartite tricarboxylate transporter substrate binding protein [Hyphomicrobiales bacterium]
MVRRLVLAAASLLALIAGTLPAAAQAWPARAITIVVPFPPGGGVDVLARIAAERLSAAMKATVVVENRPGGGGTVGTRAVARAAPDGYTLMMAHTGTIAINPSLYANAGFDPRKDFTAVGMIASMPVALIAHPSFAARTVADVIAIARKEPGKLNFGTSAIGTGGYLTAEYFKSAAGVQMQIVPYRGTAPLMNDLIGGHVPVSFGVLPPAIGNIQSGKLRAIAVTGQRRFSLLPDVPTAAESGLPGFDSVLLYGLVGPAGIPRDIVGRLNKELRSMAETDLVKQRVQAEGGDVMTSTPEGYAASIDREETKWSTLIRKLNLRVD